MKTALESAMLMKEVMQTLSEVDDVIKEVTSPAKTSNVSTFMRNTGTAVAIAINKNQSVFAFTSYGLEIYNPAKAKIIQ